MQVTGFKNPVWLIIKTKSTPSFSFAEPRTSGAGLNLWKRLGVMGFFNLEPFAPKGVKGSVSRSPVSFLCIIVINDYTCCQKLSEIRHP